ncbi:MAG: DNA recombination protein RmuC [bacterium]|nr:DNA recombination protein RmuC [bacterium]
MSDILLIFLLITIFVGLFLWQRKGSDTSSSMLIQQQIQELQRTIDARLGDSVKLIQQQHGQSSQLIRDVTVSLVQLQETNKQVLNFSDQLQDLQDILKNPKQRGILGEYYLETLLKNTMPPGSFQMQYAFQDGSIVDAAVFVKDKVIPVDSKFSIENYNRLSQEKDPLEKERLEKLFVNDLKLRIQETAKYIRPQEGTMEFAFMFIPHEAIYYDLLINKVGAVKDDTENLIQRAANKFRVIIVSPTSFLAYLQTVLQGLKALQIEEQAKTIIKRVGDLGDHLRRYEEYHAKLGSSLGTTVNHFNASNKELRKIDKDVLKIGGVSPEIQAIELERPEDLQRGE